MHHVREIEVVQDGTVQLPQSRVSMSRSLMSSGFVFVFSYIASLPLLLFVVG